MKEKSYKYICNRYVQNSDEPNLISFTANSEDIIQWSGVPSKTSIFHGGFQRALGDRYQKISTFFANNGKSPTSVVIAFRPGIIKFGDLSYPENWPSRDDFQEIPNFSTITFKYKDYDQTDDLETLRKEVATIIKERFTQEELDEIIDQESEEEIDDAEEEIEDDAEDISQPEEDPFGLYATSMDTNLDIGTSRLKDFLDFISSEKKVNQWIDEKNNQRETIRQKKGKKSKKENLILNSDPEIDLKKALVGLLKPAIIVDGQHRVNGAACTETEKPIEFTVCAVPEASWVEQVYQFVVINKLGKPISGEFLTSIVSTSLKNSEINEICELFEDIGIGLEDTFLMRDINFNESSPFYNMVEQPGISENKKDMIPTKGIIKVAKRWYNLTAGRKPEWKKTFRDGIPGKTVEEKVDNWRHKGYWAKYFFAFWGAIKEKYKKDGIWESSEGFYLLYIVTMTVLQDYYMKVKQGANVVIKDPKHLFQDVTDWLEYLPATLFTGWQQTGLQSGNKPDMIVKVIELSLEGKSIKEIRKSAQLFQKTEKS